MALNPDPPSRPRRPKRGALVAKALILLGVLVAGLAGGFLLHDLSDQAAHPKAGSQNPSDLAALIDQVNPPEGYALPATFSDVGPRLVAAGVIDLDRFVQLYQQAGRPLTGDQQTILAKGSNARVVIDSRDAYFLLNFFWALGLVNDNPVLTDGPMMTRGQDQVGNFASTGGWTLGTKPATELYASAEIISLTEEQQARLEEVASAVYRPCCDNPTRFPDCNHGMAMLGLLELMASQNAGVEAMFAAAKYVNAFWFPQQMLELATLFKLTQDTDFAHTDARQVVSERYSSASGFQSAHAWLTNNGLLPQVPDSGGSCGV